MWMVLYLHRLCPTVRVPADGWSVSAFALTVVWNVAVAALPVFGVHVLLCACGALSWSAGVVLKWRTLQKRVASFSPCFIALCIITFSMPLVVEACAPTPMNSTKDPTDTTGIHSAYVVMGLLGGLVGLRFLVWPTHQPLNERSTLTTPNFDFRHITVL